MSTQNILKGLIGTILADTTATDKKLQQEAKNALNRVLVDFSSDTGMVEVLNDVTTGSIDLKAYKQAATDLKFKFGSDTDAQKQIDTLTLQVNSLTSEKKALESRNVKLTEELGRITGERDRLQGQLDTTLQDFADAEKALGAANSEITALQQQLQQKSLSPPQPQQPHPKVPTSRSTTWTPDEINQITNLHQDVVTIDQTKFSERGKKVVTAPNSYGGGAYFIHSVLKKETNINAWVDNHLSAIDLQYQPLAYIAVLGNDFNDTINQLSVTPRTPLTAANMIRILQKFKTANLNIYDSFETMSSVHNYVLHGTQIKFANKAISAAISNIPPYDDAGYYVMGFSLGKYDIIKRHVDIIEITNETLDWDRKILPLIAGAKKSAPTATVANQIESDLSGDHIGSSLSDENLWAAADVSSNLTSLGSIPPKQAPVAAAPSTASALFEKMFG